EGEPSRGIPAVTWKLSPSQTSFSLFDLADELRTRGWLVPAYTLPSDQQATAVQRIVVRHGFSLDMADLLLADFRSALEKLDSRPPSRPLDTNEGAGFNHDATPRVKAV
ncbi:MAG: glutamate decarboxylase, partial [Frondihabitans sp.]|nr:glutamate decarboxylase [Frondihabitans sp.]